MFPRKFTEKTKALFLYNNRFARIWNSEGVNFNRAVKELKSRFKIVDKDKNNDNVNGYTDIKNGKPIN